MPLSAPPAPIEVRPKSSPIDVEFFDGSPAAVFSRAVEAHVRHGLPLSQADRPMWRATAAEVMIAERSRLDDDFFVFFARLPRAQAPRPGRPLLPAGSVWGLE